MSQIQSQIATAIDAGHWAAGVSATYNPLAGGPGVPVNVVIERAQILTDDGRVILAAEDRWILIRAAEYSPEPAAGDRIVVNGETYVVSLEAGQKYVWEWVDRYNLRRRVYAKRISASVPAV